MTIGMTEFPFLRWLDRSGGHEVLSPQTTEPAQAARHKTAANAGE